MQHYGPTQTARLTLTPVNGGDLPYLIHLKADPLVFGQMLGGVRSAWQTVEDLAADVSYWGHHGVGMFAVREGGQFQGITGIHTRADGRGQALRFAIWPAAGGRGLAREAAAMALRFAHENAGLARVVAVCRADNFASRMVLGAIGMTECEIFPRGGETMLVYESLCHDIRAKRGSAGAGLGDQAGPVRLPPC